MKTIPIFLLFFAVCCLYSCNNNAPIDNSSTTANNFVGNKNRPYKFETLRPFSFQFSGKIGSDKAIELFLSYNPLDWNNDCVSVLGDYNNTNEQHSSTSLQGELCLEEGKISLHAPKTETNIESFKGQLEGHLQSIKGQYIANGNAQNGAFELYNNTQSIAPKTLQLFAQKLQEHLQQNKDFGFEKIAIDEKGLFIKNFQTETLTLKNFSSTNLKWTKNLSSTNKRIDESETIDLWFYNDNAEFVIVINSFVWEENIAQDGTSTETEKIQYQVWKLNGTTFENIYLEQPDKTDLSKINWYAITQNGVLQLHQNKPEGLWEWN